MEIYDAQELAQRNLIVKHYAGSHAYGTALPTSDIDFRGIFVAQPVNVRTPFFPITEVEVSTEQDTKLYELANFIKLVVDCNPNVVETLWVADRDIVFRTPAYDLLRRHAPDLLCSKIAFTTSGYALAQLKRIKGHNKWITQADKGIKKLRHAFKMSEIDYKWLEEHFDETIVKRVVE